MTRRTYSPRNVFPSAAFRKRLLPAAIVAAGQLIAPPIALAGPEGGNVVAGSGSITKSEKQTTITQRSDRLIAEWDSFDLAVDEVVTYLQPGRDAVALNRILSNSASNIRGRINANGHVVLINPRGIVFGESAQVNVGGIIASGLDINDEDFLNGDFVFSEVANTEGKVINQGMITAATGGNVVLQGKSVKNEGLITAHLGSVNLASGLESVVTFDEAGLIGVRVTRSQLQGESEDGSIVGGSGQITAEQKRTLIEQYSDRIAIDWESFDLDADEVVSFLQPGRDSVALNRILGNSASDIRGQINANGHVVLVNPRGIVFGESAQVNVGGMLASGLDIGGSVSLLGKHDIKEL
ncbi:filamentous hemagglutinin N-terminal domain-containing protein [Marinimicrobium agarilyticum]|uniref:two-partner secretion domain-containing protein n=1 Tax=Marinimicrobium agarilyticum TaxID=306546 RepID=UPI00041CA5DF|nr:filamentous hemagglutinin N-terminal domain-containing protein [Marinimicrobium agarilyticum]